MSDGIVGSVIVGIVIGGIENDSDGKLTSIIGTVNAMIGIEGSDGMGIVIGGIEKDSDGNERSIIGTVKEIVGRLGRLGIGIVIGGIVIVGKLHALTQIATFTLVDGAPATPLGP